MLGMMVLMLDRGLSAIKSGIRFLIRDPVLLGLSRLLIGLTVLWPSCDLIFIVILLLLVIFETFTLLSFNGLLGGSKFIMQTINIHEPGSYRVLLSFLSCVSCCGIILLHWPHSSILDQSRPTSEIPGVQESCSLTKPSSLVSNSLITLVRGVRPGKDIHNTYTNTRLLWEITELF